MTNYTVGSSIFCKLHLRVFDFLTFILQGPQFCKKYTLGLSKIGIFSYTLGLGVRPNILTPRHFLSPPPGWLPRNKALVWSMLKNIRTLLLRTSELRSEYFSALIAQLVNNCLIETVLHERPYLELSFDSLAEFKRRISAIGTL